MTYSKTKPWNWTDLQVGDLGYVNQDNTILLCYLGQDNTVFSPSYMKLNEVCMVLKKNENEGIVEVWHFSSQTKGNCHAIYLNKQPEK